MKGVNKMFEIKYCPKCKDNKNFQNEYHTDWNPVQGYFIAFSLSDDICPYCNWEDDGTLDANAYRSINRGSIADYRQKIQENFNQYYINKWIKDSF